MEKTTIHDVFTIPDLINTFKNKRVKIGERNHTMAMGDMTNVTLVEIKPPTAGNGDYTINFKRHGDYLAQLGEDGQWFANPGTSIELIKSGGRKRIKTKNRKIRKSRKSRNR